MSLVYWLSKFSPEAMLVEGFLIGCVALSYFAYLLFLKRRYGVNKKQIPDHIIRAFLIELLSYSEGFKNQLFGTDFKITAGAGLTAAAGATATAAASGVADNADLTALKAALAHAVTKQAELQKTVDALTKDKSGLEAKVAAGGGKPAPAAGGADPKALTDALDKIAKLESKLAEYEVIEDDLANLKKYQQENKQLKAQLEGKGGAAPVAAAPEPVAAAASPPPSAPPAAEAPAAASEPTPVAAAEDNAATASAAANFDALVDKVEESLATPAGASAVDPQAAAQAQTAPPVVEEPAAEPPPPAAAPAAAAEAPKEPPRDKSDADLLNEFERMLSS